MNWIPCHQHTSFSLLDGLSKPKQVASRCAELGYSAAGLTDHGNLGASIQFIRSCNDKNIKPLVGVELYLSQKDCYLRDPTNRQLSHLCILAKNYQGWKNLIKLTSLSNTKDIYYYKARLDLTTLSQFCDGNLISFSGHPGSDLANILFGEKYKLAYNSRSEDEVASHLDPNYENNAIRLAETYQDIFGKGNFYLEIQLIDQDNFPAATVISSILREISVKIDIPCVATADSHYPTKEDAVDQRILLCSAFETTLQNVRNKIENNEDVTLSGFFRSNNYHIPSLPEMQAIHTELELANSIQIADMCEKYDVFSPPQLPSFECPNGMEQNEYLRQLCREGWAKKINGKIDKSRRQEYIDRIKMELDVIQTANLAGYFLIVQDFVNWAKNQGWLLGRSRGSAGGCLASYLTNITGLDPIPYNLLFSRFFNTARAKTGELPDIDVDFPTDKKPLVLEYLKQKYGQDKVCQMATFSSMQGRGALKDVFRAHSIDFEESNRITENIPQDASIADHLQVMKDVTGHSSSIQWTLENEPNTLKEWCYLDDKGELQGPYAIYFAQAMRLEGVKRNAGKHASGVIISQHSLPDIVPMIRDNSTEDLIVGIEMEDAQAMGLVKFDILGVRLLDKLMTVQNLLKNGVV